MQDPPFHPIHPKSTLEQVNKKAASSLQWVGYLACFHRMGRKTSTCLTFKQIVTKRSKKRETRTTNRASIERKQCRWLWLILLFVVLTSRVPSRSCDWVSLYHQAPAPDEPRCWAHTTHIAAAEQPTLWWEGPGLGFLSTVDLGDWLRPSLHLSH